MKKYYIYLDQFNFSLTLRRDITGSPNSRNEVTRDLSAGRVDDALQAKSFTALAHWSLFFFFTELITAETSTSESTTPPSTREENVPPQTTTKEVSFEHKTGYCIDNNNNNDNKLLLL